MIHKRFLSSAADKATYMKIEGLPFTDHTYNVTNKTNYNLYI